jgi:Peptidase M15
MAIARDEVLMQRDAEFPLTPELETNLNNLLIALNKFRDIYNIPMIVTSGYRPGHYNSDAGGAPDSPHITCEACDFHDPDGAIDLFCTNNLNVLIQCGLYLESPAATVGWCHLQIRPTINRVFIP